MSASSASPFSVPILVLRESTSHRVKVEAVNNETYEGKLTLVDGSTGNITLEDVIHRSISKEKSFLTLVVIPSRNIKLVVLPEIVRRAKVFDNVVESIQKRLREGRNAFGVVKVRKGGKGGGKLSAAAKKKERKEKIRAARKEQAKEDRQKKRLLRK